MVILAHADAANLDFVPDESVQLTVTSPPYDNLRTYNGYTFDFEAVANELFRVTASGGVVVWVVGDATIKGSETGTSFRQALYFKEIGFNLHDTMIYASDKPPLTHNRYEQQFEYMFVLSKRKPSVFIPIMQECKHAGKSGKRRTFRHDGAHLEALHKSDNTVKPTKIKGNIWWFATGAATSAKEVFRHPATFPEQLAADHITTWSNPGDLILDPFSGSGTTAKMAHLLGREFIGCDISMDYLELAKERVEKAGAEVELLDLVSV